MDFTWESNMPLNFGNCYFDHSWEMVQLLTLNYKGTKGHQSGWIVIAVGLRYGGYDPCLDVW